MCVPKWNRRPILVISTEKLNIFEFIQRRAVEAVEEVRGHPSANHRANRMNGREGRMTGRAAHVDIAV